MGHAVRRGPVLEVYIAYLVITEVVAILVAVSGLGKILRGAQQVRVLHETIGIPLQYFAVLAACEFAGAAGLVLGIWWPLLGVAAGLCLVLYFIGAMVAHLRVDDVKGMGPASFMLVLAAAALTMRLLK
jgi:hypothetical protein